jgi:outer membrane protein OmpA-like peptidoglycan-associated protein
MHNTIKTLSLSVVLAATLATPALACHNGQKHLVVNDVHGGIVRDVRGNCVLTKWTNGTNTCDGEVAAEFAGFTENERTVYFAFNSDKLSAEGIYKLNRLLGKIKESGKVLSATIIGHADQIGDAAYNQTLSARRANAVKNYLAAHGFNDTKVATVTAEGENAPVTEGCEKAGGKAQQINCLQPDRRVEIKFSLAE